MAADIFTTIAAGARNIKLVGMPKALLKMGGVDLLFPMVDISKGNQGSRLQIDVALDGTQHVAGDIGGVGTYSMLFMDCPIVLNAAPNNNGGSGQSMLHHYLSRVNIPSLSIEVYLNNPSQSLLCNTAVAGPTTIAHFQGIATNVIITFSPPDDQTATAFIKTQLDAKGRWLDQ